MSGDGWLVAGLGNPGKHYDGTWHNAGRMAGEMLALRHGIRIKRRRFRGLTGEGFIDGHKVRVLLPNTFMNLSGDSLSRAMAYEGICPDRLIVLYDDFDLPLGRIRIRDQGSAGSHKGMKSILSYLPNSSFIRIRIGIGPIQGQDAAAFVLSKIPSSARAQLEAALADACDAVELIVRGQQQKAQEQYNKKA
ncbi:MAG TPA: aminoacyl-tRNA hydrolase [Bacillota bacterium]|jgi:PTH1 family peptidyl-tRNA hydrolase|nr:aminoacyl-tRNA hydrolase [Fastidiosipila sp.]HPX93869.1 aminoacyl-tRNA hydrolase [Bacillota bacterium]HQB81433.1 aminoacyl-tRNA hydrolase [Bacillota bacterium]